MAWRDSITPRAILVVGWILFVIYAYPGYMSYDSVWQLEQARHLAPYNDWHPPMMALLWHVTDSIITGPFPMLVLQSLAYLLGCYGILVHVVGRRSAALVAVAMLLLPQNITTLAVIWKDSQMAGYLMAAIALLLCEKRAHRLLGYFFIFLATGMRYNAAAATLPIVLLLFARGRPLRWWKRGALGLAIWLGITALSLLVSSQLVDERSHLWPKGAAPLDLAGIVRYSPGLSDAELRRDTPGVRWVPTEEIRNYTRIRYSPAANYMDVTELPTRVIETPTTDADYAAIAAAWRTMVVKHPWALLRHRIAVFQAQIMARVSTNLWAGIINESWAEAQLEHKASHSRVQGFVIWRILKWDSKIGPPVWIFLVLTIVLLPMCRSRRLPLMLLGSGLFHEIGLFLIAPAIDYRYSHWMVVTCVLGGVVLFIERLRSRP